MVFPTFFSLSLNFAIRSSWFEPQSAPSLVFADCIELFHFWLQRYNQPDFGINHLVMSMCKVVPCVVEKGFLPWPVCSLGKTLLAFALLHFVLQGQTCLLLQVSLDFLLLHSNPLLWIWHPFWHYFVEVFLVFIDLINFSFFSIRGWDKDLDYCDVEWFALERNQDHSIIFEIAPKYCISDFCWLWGLLYFF